MATSNVESHYDVLGLPRNCGNRHIRTQLLTFTGTDLSELNFESLKKIVSENQRIVMSYGVLTNKAAREAYDQCLPDLDAHSIDASTIIKDWAPGPERDISESKKCQTRQRSEMMVQKVQEKLPLEEIKELERFIQRGERSLREWRRLEIRRLMDVKPSYLGIFSRRVLRYMAKMGVNKKGIREEFQERERHLLLAERLKLLLRTLEVDLNRIREDSSNAF